MDAVKRAIVRPDLSVMRPQESVATIRHARDLPSPVVAPVRCSNTAKRAPSNPATVRHCLRVDGIRTTAITAVVKKKIPPIRRTRQVVFARTAHPIAPVSRPVEAMVVAVHVKPVKRAQPASTKPVVPRIARTKPVAPTDAAEAAASAKVD